MTQKKIFQHETTSGKQGKTQTIHNRQENTKKLLRPPGHDA